MGVVEPKFVAQYGSAVEEALRCVLAGDAPLREVVRVHVGLEDESGVAKEVPGKRLHPAITLFIAEEFGGGLNEALPAAVSLGLLHEFSRIRDDAQDAHKGKRGRSTVWSCWGAAQAINVGDLMLALALAEAEKAGAAVLDRLLGAVREMIEGQALDVLFEARWPSLDEHIAMIDKKTGALFRCACALGAIVADAPRELRECLSEFGAHIGRAYRIRDDLLGIWGSASGLGKPIGSDLRRKKKSYPVIAAAEKAKESERRALEIAFADETISDKAAERILETMEQLGVREACEAEVNGHLEIALSTLERLPFREAGVRSMIELCEWLRPTKALGDSQ